MASSSLLRRVVRDLLQYPDVLRRRRIRRAARRLVTCRAFPQTAATDDQFAQLGLLRLLWLQRETRRSARAGHAEAAAMLARACVDTCLVGLFCLHVPGAPSRLEDQSLWSLNKLFGRVSNPSTFPGTVLRDLMDQMGSPQPPPNMRAIVAAVTKATGQQTAEDLYQGLYEPLSMLFVHSGPLSLARHLDARNRVRARRHPINPWTNLAALRTADACVGLLAAAVADLSGSTSVEFVAYASDHRERTLAPLAVIFARGAPTSVDWPRVPETVRQFREFVRYCRSGADAADVPSARDARIRDVGKRLIRTLNPTVEDETLDVWIAGLLKEIARSQSSPTEAA